MNQDSPSFKVTITSPKGEVHVADNVGSYSGEGAELRAFASAWVTKNKFHAEFDWPEPASARQAYGRAKELGFIFHCERI